jgi:uncharacterized protein YaaQ
MLKKKGAAIVKAELRRQLKAAREKEYRAASLASFGGRLRGGQQPRR